MLAWQVSGDPHALDGNTTCGRYLQLAAVEPRIKAIATHGGCYGPQYAIFQQASPHFKRQFMLRAR